MVWTIVTLFRDKTLSIMPRKVENVVFGVAKPKSCWLLVIWNSYKKRDREDATQNQNNNVRNVNLRFCSGHRWILRASEFVFRCFQCNNVQHRGK